MPFKITFSDIMGPESFKEILHCSRVLRRSSSAGRSNLAAAAAVYGIGSSWMSSSFGYDSMGRGFTTMDFVGSCSFLPPTWVCGSWVNVSRICFDALDRSAGASPY